MLFNTKDINTSIDIHSDVLSSMNSISPTHTLNRTGKASKVKNDIVDALSNNCVINFVSNGQFNLHELIESIIVKNGICFEAFISAWAIKPEPARVICSLKDKKLLQKIHFILDHRVKGQEHDAMSIIEPCASSISYKNIHAKVVLLRFENLEVSIVTSANFTKNSRIEVGVVSTNKSTFNFQEEWMRKAMI